MRATAARRQAPRSVRAWVRLLQVQKLVLAEVRDELDDDVSLARFDLLANLHNEDAQSLVALSRHMLVTAGNLTGLVDRAERDGLVVRKEDSSDRRTTRVCLTSKGRAVYGTALVRHDARLERAFSALGRAEQDTLADLLGKVRDSLRRKEDR